MELIVIGGLLALAIIFGLLHMLSWVEALLLLGVLIMALSGPPRESAPHHAPPVAASEEI